MKLAYYGYSVHDITHDQRFRFDLREFFNCYCQFENVEFKNRFRRNGENVYLLNVAENFFLYVTTRQSEIIKRINSDNLDIAEIGDLLQNNESLGFASYARFERSYFAFASSQMAPRVPSFADFINDLFGAIGLADYKFICHPFLDQSNMTQALSAPFLGRSTIQIQSNHNLFAHLSGVFGADAPDFVDVDSIEVTIKPRGRANIRQAIAKVLNSPSIQQTQKLVCRARLDSLDDALVDLHLAGYGLISNELTKGTDLEIYNQILQALTQNQLLREKVNLHEQADEFTAVAPNDFALLHDLSEWAARIPDVPANN
jgi:hypothetical protein